MKTATGLMMVVALSACSSSSGMFGSSSPEPAASGSSSSFSDRFNQLFSRSSSSSSTTAMASAQSEDQPQQVYCPVVDVRAGASTLSVANGGNDANAMQLRYQGTIGQTARECSAAAGNISIKVGVQGRIILGPVGTPGQVEIPLRYALVQEGPEPKTIWTKLYRFPVDITEGQSSVPFTHVEEDLTVPKPKPADLESYVVYVGFDTLAMTPQPKKPKVPAKKR